MQCVLKAEEVIYKKNKHRMVEKFHVTNIVLRYLKMVLVLGKYKLHV